MQRKYEAAGEEASVVFILKLLCHKLAKAHAGFKSDSVALRPFRISADLVLTLKDKMRAYKILRYAYFRR